jgi:transposase
VSTLANQDIADVDQPDALRKKIALLSQELKNVKARNAWLEEQFRLSRHRQFGPSSEKTVPAGQQALAFNEAEALADADAPEPEFEETAPNKRRVKAKGLRAEQKKDLDVETITYSLPPEQMKCPQCGDTLHKMSEEVREEFKIVPAKVTILRIVRDVCACRNCQKNEIKTPVVTATMPKPAFPNSPASPSLVAYLMTQKYADGMPLYRQEQSCFGFGTILSRQTMANWIIRGATDWLTPLYNRLKSDLLKRDHAQSDDTTVQVLHEEGRIAQSVSYMWLFRSGRQGPAIVLFEYQQTRKADHPKAFLKDFKGYLQVDGYAGYGGISPDIVLVGCWAHARRKFLEALAVLPADLRNAEKVKKSSMAQVGLDFCDRLFGIDAKLKEATAEERHAVRLVQSVAVLEKMQEWLSEAGAVPPKSKIGDAIGYCRNQWKQLTAFLADGRLELDNNRSERSIKPFVVGRKNWMFSNTAKGATASAVTYSIIETAKENGLNPFAYLTHVFEQMPLLGPTGSADIDAILPWSESLPASCRATNRKS